MLSSLCLTNSIDYIVLITAATRKRTAYPTLTFSGPFPIFLHDPLVTTEQGRFIMEKMYNEREVISLLRQINAYPYYPLAKDWEKYDTTIRLVSGAFEKLNDSLTFGNISDALTAKYGDETGKFYDEVTQEAYENLKEAVFGTEKLALDYGEQDGNETLSIRYLHAAPDVLLDSITEYITPELEKVFKQMEPDLTLIPGPRWKTNYTNHGKKIAYYGPAILYGYSSKSVDLSRVTVPVFIVDIIRATTDDSAMRLRLENYIKATNGTLQAAFFYNYEIKEDGKHRILSLSWWDHRRSLTQEYIAVFKKPHYRFKTKSLFDTVKLRESGWPHHKQSIEVHAKAEAKHCVMDVTPRKIWAKWQKDAGDKIEEANYIDAAKRASQSDDKLDVI